MAAKRAPSTRRRRLAGSVTAFGLTYPVYRIFLIGVGLGSCAMLAIWLNFSTSGLHVRAVSQDPSVARMMGINADRLSLLVTSLSAAFAGVAGVLAGPYLSVDPGMDVTMIVSCLIIVVIGGTGSIAGAIVAALLFGFVQVAGSVFLPDLAALAPYALLMAVLLIAPARNRTRSGARLNGEAAARATPGAARSGDPATAAGTRMLAVGRWRSDFRASARVAPPHFASEFVLRLGRWRTCCSAFSRSASPS